MKNRHEQAVQSTNGSVHPEDRRQTLTFRLPRWLARAFKVHAAATGTPMQIILEDLLRDYLQKQGVLTSD